MSTSDTDNSGELMGELIKELSSSYGDAGGVSCASLIAPTDLSNDPLISELVFSMLVWEASIAHAVEASACIHRELIDLNELRVCTAGELAAILPSRYPRAQERSERLLSVLNTIFRREHQLSLTHLREMNKREVIAYFESIDGLAVFASSRVILLGLGWHAFPMDDWLTKQLASRGITETSLGIEEQTTRMERLVRASDSLKYYTLVEHWASDLRRAKSTAGSKSKKTSKKTTSKAKSATKTPAKAPAKSSAKATATKSKGTS